MYVLGGFYDHMRIVQPHLHSRYLAVSTGHSLLCEMTLIRLLPNLAESISCAIREEEEKERGGEAG